MDLLEHQCNYHQATMMAQCLKWHRLQYQYIKMVKYFLVTENVTELKHLRTWPHSKGNLMLMTEKLKVLLLELYR
jgi:hypothetical protein